MSKKNIILLIGVLIVIGVLLFIYQSDFLFKKNVDYDSEKNNNFPITSTEEDSDESPNTTSNETKASNTGNISDEACIEINAYALRMVELGSTAYLAQGYGYKIEELEKKYGIDSDSEYFDEYCNNRFFEDITMTERLEEKMRELGSDIE
ncbi:MAG TPA: hypothetical protein PLB74_02380 [Candidatus Paceibacterota bacterium]|nr:hypothetical protein [Candidatus Paceibacterota bacterium]